MNATCREPVETENAETYLGLIHVRATKDLRKKMADAKVTADSSFITATYMHIFMGLR